MPVKTYKDAKGCYVKWGSSGKRYYYKCGDQKALEQAKKKAEEQGRAAYASGYKENES